LGIQVEAAVVEMTEMMEMEMMARKTPLIITLMK
jgi:hypothetical protein